MQNEMAGPVRMETNLPARALYVVSRAVRQAAGGFAARYYSLPVLDLWATYGVQPGVPVMKEAYMPDGQHPNDAGHVILTNKIAKFIESL